MCLLHMQGSWGAGVLNQAGGGYGAQGLIIARYMLSLKILRKPLLATDCPSTQEAQASGLVCCEGWHLHDLGPTQAADMKQAQAQRAEVVPVFESSVTTHANSDVD